MLRLTTLLSAASTLVAARQLVPGSGSREYLEAATTAAKRHYQDVFKIREEAKQLIAEKRDLTAQKKKVEVEMEHVGKEHDKLKKELDTNLGKEVKRAEEDEELEQQAVQETLYPEVAKWTKATQQRQEEESKAIDDKMGLLKKVKSIQKQIAKLKQEEVIVKNSYLINRNKVNGSIAAYKYASTKLDGVITKQKEAEEFVSKKKAAVESLKKQMADQIYKVDKHLDESNDENVNLLKTNEDSQEELKEKLSSVKEELHSWSEDQAKLKKNMEDATSAYEKVISENKISKRKADYSKGSKEAKKLADAMGWKDGEDWAYGDAEGEKRVDEMMAESGKSLDSEASEESDSE